MQVIVKQKIWWPWTFDAWGRGVKIAGFENVRFLAQPSGAVWQRTLSFRLIWIQHLAFSYTVPKIRIPAVPIFVPWAIKLEKKIPKLQLASCSKTAHIRRGRRSSRSIPPYNIEVGYELGYEKSIARVSAIFYFQLSRNLLFFTSYKQFFVIFIAIFLEMYPNDFLEIIRVCRTY